MHLQHAGPSSGSPIALITGASRGIGAAYAKALAKRGYRLLLVSRDESRLSSLIQEIRSHHGTMIHYKLLDLATSEASMEFYNFSLTHCEAPDLLIHNAGFGLYGPFSSFSPTTIQKMAKLHINFIVESTRAFLPGMISRGSGTIINVSSLAGFFSLPYMAEYAATKAFLISFSEALAQEVRPFGITIQVCCPGQTDTDFHQTAGFRPKSFVPSLTPEEVVRKSLSAIKFKSPTVTVGWSGHLAILLARLLPRGFLARLAASRVCPSKSTGTSNRG